MEHSFGVCSLLFAFLILLILLALEFFCRNFLIPIADCANHKNHSGPQDSWNEYPIKNNKKIGRCFIGLFLPP